MPNEGPVVSEVRRLHPFTVVLGIVGVVRAWVVPVGLASVVASEGGGLAWWIWASLAIGSVSLVYIVLRYVAVRYGVINDQLVLRDGILFRTHRTIPVSRVQNVHLKSGPLQRLCGVAEIRVETAGTGELEFHLSVVGKKDAETFRRLILLRRSEVADAAAPLVEAPELIWHSTLRQLLIAGATSHRLGAILAGFVALLELAGDLGTSVTGPIDAFLQRWFAADSVATVVAALVGIVFLGLAGWFISIVFTVMTFFGFRLHRVGEKITRVHGLLTRVEAAVPAERVQIVRLEAPWLRRRLGYLSVHVEMAGSAENRESQGTSTLCPLAPQREAPRICEEVFQGLGLEGRALLRVHPNSKRRGLLRCLVQGTLLLALAAIWLQTRVLWGAPIVLAWAFAWSLASYHALGYHRGGGYLVARAGVLTRRWWIFPEDRLQSVALTQSPFQRSWGLVTLRLATAVRGSAVRVVDLSVADASVLFESLSLRSATGARGHEGL